MKRLWLTASVAATLLGCASAAGATTSISFTPPSAVDGSIGGNFGNDGGIAMGTFTDTYTFSWPSAGVTSGTISSSFTAMSNDLNFSQVTLNGVAFTPLVGGTNLPEFRLTGPQMTASGQQTLVVMGYSPGPAATYSGTLTFTPTAPPTMTPGGGVPEPAGWALMIVGFGGVGAMVRRRQGVARSA